MPPQTHPTPSNLHHLHFSRITLSNGYRAYRLRQPPATTAVPVPAVPKPKKTVRFVDGHDTIPDVVNNDSSSGEGGSGSEERGGKSRSGSTDEEAEGWVPVMVAEEYGGDEWMSLTGSWMLMRGPAK
ncbi:hypothetical protein C8A05DRAFT_32257 [Staphylotrichum tortipilum]|uniref:Uncharacterized protein n=1 Tax=Staphylotrichum tortipilum TaxID=2831512 RepID=A0AAN6MN52_9PEZI|nr:hypothetical protein C8A05DRAFT_32257 [Staphylotrichum longicolle]